MSGFSVRRAEADHKEFADHQRDGLSVGSYGYDWQDALIGSAQEGPNVAAIISVMESCRARRATCFDMSGP